MNATQNSSHEIKNKLLAVFKTKLYSMAAVSAKEWDYIQTKVKLRKFTAGQSISGLGNHENYFIYVCDGLFRELDTNNFGEISISRYLKVGSVHIGIDPLSSVSIEAINDSTILVLSEREVYKLEHKYKSFRKHFRLFLIEYIKHLQLRGDILASKSGEIKYQLFYTHYEQICKYQPLAEQARYLAMNKDTVYRLRADHFPE